MRESWKLVVGFVGITVGFVAGLVGLFAVMSRAGGTILDRGPTVTVLVSIGMCGGGALLVGYLALTAVGFMEKRAKRTRRKKKRAKK